MGAWTDRLGDLVRDASLAATLLTGLVALAMVGCRQPARRCILARAALLGLLAVWPFVLAPRSRIELRRPIRWFTNPISASRQAQPASTAQAPRPARVDVARWAWRGLTLAYLSGTAANLAWLALGHCGAAWLVRRSQLAGLSTEAILDAVAVAPQGRRPIVRVTARLARPVLVGVVRPTILIPAEMEEPHAGASLRLSLLHELAHAHRADPVFTLIGGLAQAIWFFLPTVWWIRAQMQLDQEFLADHLASHGFEHSASYASSLVEIAAPPSARGAPRREIAPALREKAGALVGSTLFVRVLMLVRCPFPVEGRAPVWWRWTTPLAVAAVTLAVSSLTLGHTSTQASQAVAPPPPSSHGSFSVVRLIMEPDEHAHAETITPPVVLPPLLPNRFDLTFETWATSADLPRIHVNGYRLFPDPKLTAGWHAIVMHRDGRAVHFTLDGRPTRFVADPGAPPKRLTLIPAPHQAGLFRNLVLTW